MPGTASATSTYNSYTVTLTPDSNKTPTHWRASPRSVLPTGDTWPLRQPWTVWSGDTVQFSAASLDSGSTITLNISILYAGNTTDAINIEIKTDALELTADMITDTSARISWINNTRANGLWVTEKTTPETSKQPSAFLTNPGTTGNVAITGLEPGTEYVLKFTFHKGPVSSFRRTTVTFTTTGGGEPPPPKKPDPPDPPVVPDAPSVPTNVAVSDITDKSVKLSWTKVATATGYEWKHNINDTEIDVGDVDEISITGLDPMTQYGFLVRAYNSGGFSGFVQVVATTLAKSATPDPPPGPGPIAPVRSPGAVALTYQITKSDGSTKDISRQVTSCKISYGAKLDEEIAYWVKSSGEAMLNDWRKLYAMEYKTWTKLAVYVGSTQIFDFYITGIEVDNTERNIMTLKLELPGSFNLPFVQNLKFTVGLTDLSLEGYLTASGLNLSRVPNVTLPNIFIAAGYGYPDVVEIQREGLQYSVKPRFESGSDNFLEDVGAFGSLFFFEQRIKNGFRVYPLSALLNDNRTPLATLPASALILRKDFQVQLEDYRRDRQVYNTATAATASLSGTKTVKGKGVKVASSGKRERAKIVRAEAAEQGQSWRYSGSIGSDYWIATIEFDDFLSPEDARNVLEVTMSDLSTRTLISYPRFEDNGGYFWVVSRIGSDFGFSWTAKVRRKVTLKQKTFVSEQEGGHGSIATSSIAIPADGSNVATTEAAIVSKLDAAAQFQAEILRMTQLLLQDGDLTNLQIQPGDLINMKAANQNLRCLVVGVDFVHQGLKPIELRWNCISLGPIPQAGGGGAQDDPFQVKFNQRPVIYYEEEVYFGEHTNIPN